MELVAIILVIAAVAAAEVLIFGKYALKGIYYSASVNKAEVYDCLLYTSDAADEL